MLFLLMGKEPYNGEWYPEEVFEDIDEARAAAKDFDADHYETKIETLPFWTAGEYFKYKEREKERQQRANNLNSESLRNALNESAKAVQELPTYDFSGIEVIK